MKTYTEFINEASDPKAGDVVVVNTSTKLKNGMKIRDGEEYKVRTTSKDSVKLHSANSSFNVSWKDFEKYFDV